MPTINLTDDELAAVTAAIRHAIEEFRFPHAPRLDPLRAALGKFEAATEPTPHPKAPPAARADKRGRGPSRRPSLRSPPALSWAGCRPTADHESRLPAPYLTRQRS
jgi:hypothetical protein